MDRAQIDCLLASRASPLGVDDDAVYRVAGYKAVRQGSPHGSGVLHLLARKLTFDALWAVQLPEDAVQDTAGGWLGYHVLIALNEMVSRAKKAQLWHLTVNLSYGGTAGPHDGSSMFEQALAELCTRFSDPMSRLDIVVAAGNAAGHQLHAQRTIEPDGEASFRIMCASDNPRESAIELWLPAQDDRQEHLAPDQIEVQVTSPDGQTGTAVVGQCVALCRNPAARAHTLCAGLVFAHRVAQGLNGTMILLLIRPTRTDGSVDRAPAGAWTLRLLRTGGANPVTVHGWIERNDVPIGQRRPPQTRFIADPVDSQHVNDQWCLSSAAGGPGVIVAGAVFEESGKPATYSGRNDAQTDRPHFFADGDTSQSRRGVLVPGFRSGSWGRMSGTSIAAPQVANFIAAGAPPGRLYPEDPPLPGKPPVPGSPRPRRVRRP